MKDLFSYNLVTLLNCGKAKALTGKSLYNCNFYDVSFLELEELEIENVIKAVGLYPVPFFSLKLAERKIYAKRSRTHQKSMPKYSHRESGSCHLSCFNGNFSSQQSPRPSSNSVFDR